MMGAGVGALGALVAATLNSRVASHGIGPAFNALLFSVVPTTTAAAVLFTLGSGIACEVRGRRDWFNDMLGGAGAGAVMVGIRQRSIQSGLIGALAFGAAGLVQPFFDPAGRPLVLHAQFLEYGLLQLSVRVARQPLLHPGRAFAGGRRAEGPTRDAIELGDFKSFGGLGWHAVRV